MILQQQLRIFSMPPHVTSESIDVNPIYIGRAGYHARGWWTFAAPVEGKHTKKGIKWSCPESGDVNWGATNSDDVAREELSGKLWRGTIKETGKLSNWID